MNKSLTEWLKHIPGIRHIDRWLMIQLALIMIIDIESIRLFLGLPSAKPAMIFEILVLVLSMSGLITTWFKESNHRYERVAIAFFLLVSLPLIYLGRGEHNPFLVPLAVGNGPQLPPFGRFGYTYIMGANPVIVENTLWFNQVLMFCGYQDAFSTYFTSVRALYSFLAAPIAPFVGIIRSLATINYLGWMIAAYVTWRFTLRLSGDKLAALLAVMLVSGGLGFIIHSHDYEPHLLSFVMYYIGILLIYESGVWNEARPLKTHLLLGVYLALACINYSNGLFLTVGYIAVSLWRNRWVHVGWAALIALSAQPLYVLYLNLQLAVLRGTWQWVNYSYFESSQLVESLRQWAMNLHAPKELVTIFIGGLSQFTFIEFPLVIVLGLLAWMILLRSRAIWWFFAVLFVLPIAGCMAFLHTSNTKGYIVYGISLLIYTPLAVVAARGLRSLNRSVALITAVFIAVVIGCQLFWSTGFLWGYMVPSKMFYNYGFRLDEWLPYLAEFSVPPAFSLTGAEPTPAMFGGNSTLLEAGMYASPPVASVPFSWQFALAGRVLLACYIGLLVVLAVRSRRAKMFGAGAVALGLWIVPALLPQFLPVQPLPIFSTFYSIHVPPGSKARYAVTVSDAFIAQMRKYVNEPVKVCFFTPGISSPFDVRVSGGNRQIFLESHTGSMLQYADVTLPQMLQALDYSKELEMEISVPSPEGGNASGTSIFGWQRADLPGRKFWELSPAVMGKGKGPTLPAFEIMLISSDKKVCLVGF